MIVGGALLDEISLKSSSNSIPHLRAHHSDSHHLGSVYRVRLESSRARHRFRSNELKIEATRCAIADELDIEGGGHASPDVPCHATMIDDMYPRIRCLDIDIDRNVGGCILDSIGDAGGNARSKTRCDLKVERITGSDRVGCSIRNRQ